MTLAETLLALAILAQVFWTVFVMVRAGRARLRSVREGTAPKDGLIYPYGWPTDVQQVSNNMNNQFETPTIFYALGLLAFAVKHVSLAFALVAWLYVLTRIVHTHVHTGTNDLRHRFPVFLAGVGVLMVMAAMLAASILLGRLA
ncbi:MAPEG family protein [Prosthecomicrobium sp. N25]|uniref:MAPEG family protein n=1 Tax=Prosthecomicrobium sp. N25 TaxID=3129254 RepID=UPI003076BBA0